ncbi:MAG TPA: hypothetical protein VNK96_04425 [Fimbriimonadales bacterium]|nr:hypothetical protein [Fimbriimonadales bacterium]
MKERRMKMNESRRKRTKGTALIIALAVMFALGVLALLFLRVVAGSTVSALVASERSLADGLAQAGIRYAFNQLRFSEDGADWRPLPPTPVAADIDPNAPPGLGPNSDPENPNATNPDPDYFWLRRQVVPGNTDPNDRGGPDGLGCFSRIFFRNGRALIRVRYEPTNVQIFSGNASSFTGLITEAGKLRSYTIVESVGRPGNYNPNDPTSARNPDIQKARHLSAVATIGIIESGRYITNKEQRQEPVQLGYPTPVNSSGSPPPLEGARLGFDPVSVPVFFGGFGVPAPGGYSGGVLTTGCPIYVNGSLEIHGDLRAYLHRDLGDQINIHGDLTFAPNSRLEVLRVSESGGSEVINSFLAFPSISPSFSTFGGVLRDIRELPDQQGYVRNVPRKPPPLVDEEDPNTGQLRYRLLTRDSGAIAIGANGQEFNLGSLGYGRGVYVNNFFDRGSDSEDGDFTLRYDWLNPNNGHSASNWDGPFYSPKCAYMLLLPDGFIIRRFVNRPDRDRWRTYQNTDSGRHSLRFKVGLGSDNKLRIINELTPGVVNFGSPTPSDFNKGPEFNGVVFFEGDVRIRGVIPGDDNPLNSIVPVQLTVVTLGNAYVEGSIVKGSKLYSTLGILARQNVVLNTTQFFGRSAFRPFLHAKSDSPPEKNPWRLPVDSHNPLYLSVQFAELFSNYTYTNNNQTTVPSIFIAHAADHGAQGSGSFFNLLINQGFINTAPEYLFASAYPPNAAGKYFNPPQPTIPTYGMDLETQTLPNYEKRTFRIWPISGNAMGGNGNYQFFFGGLENEFQFKKDNTIAPLGGNFDYNISRIAIQPMDVTIEAVMYAQEGSFFVIPGPWFNWDPNDRREVFTDANGRLARFNATAEWPFYGEPLDIKITIRGAISENFPPPIADQGEWLRHWGWIPKEYGESGNFIPNEHVPTGAPYNWDTSLPYVPNLFIHYDTVLISGRVGGSFNPNDDTIRKDAYGRPLPPIPKLPVGTKLFYFGEINP